MSNWISIDHRDINLTKSSENFKGIKVNIYVSPYDIPEALRGYYDTGIDKFIIEFYYISDESVKRNKQSDHITLEIGKNSNRIYKIIIDVKSIKANTIDLNLIPKKVESAIDQFVNSIEPRERKNENYKIAKDLLSKKKDEIYSELAQMPI
jgi:hypothetical protein